jgi:hypothetical protein
VEHKVKLVQYHVGMNDAARKWMIKQIVKCFKLKLLQIMTVIISQDDAFIISNSHNVTWVLSSFRYKVLWHIPYIKN